MHSDLEQFIQEHPVETQDFEYKDGMITKRAKRQAGRQTIREYISGFANSDGGVLIIGINENTPRAVAPCEPNCSELILSAARLDYIADYDLDYVRIEASLG